MAALLLAAISFPRPVHGQQVISVQYLDYRSGHPIKGIYVVVIFYKGKEILTKNIISQTVLKTDRNGKISIHVPEPTPEHLYITSTDIFFNNLSTISPAEVLKVGLVLPYPRKDVGKHPDAKVHVSAKPGEIVVLNKKLTWWDRMRREIPI